ncbi:glycosyltransferase [Chryseolinea sp. H1M3-3]|uniref:glycosyltransferase n=1 Tax=Chryseolinea sp. H1M3-3 TaxID=3034144 RepID=UPI0023EDE48C|nr:glycosyltransferase [Chryseolinea sp. H1M3-3]
MVSIIISNLNTDLTFLQARLDSVKNQTFLDWECIIVDGFSDNGSWEYLHQATNLDRRFKLYQKPRKGIYNAWNEGIKLAKGNYICIAPSDDTMDKEFIEKMVNVLDQNLQCDMAHCCLRIIDVNGKPAIDGNWDTFLSSKFFGDIMHTKHIRHAPHDGILHAFIKTVYTSITQLLIRKSVFDELGLFIEDGGSIADFEWEMRVSLFINIVHVPEYLTSWRVHNLQATKVETQIAPETYACLRKWVKQNFLLFNSRRPKDTINHSLRDLLYVYRKNEIHFLLKKIAGKNKALNHVYKRFFAHYFPYYNGLESAREYFKTKKMARLIEFI